MAALVEPAPTQVLDLRSIDVEALAPLLAEQIAAWKKDLDWDFTPSANLVHRFVQMHVLTGYALVLRGDPTKAIGYSYYVCEDGKGLIGDLYILKQYRSWEYENALFQASLDAMWQTPGVHRVESQLLMLSDTPNRRVPYTKWFQAFPRLFLEASSGTRLAPRKLSSSITVFPWTEPWQEATGRLIAGAYQNHIDSQINDQYRSAVGARRFLTNIVQYPGCGAFFAPASYAATAQGVLCGVSLASLVSHDVGHITQVCVAPSFQGTGLGYELVRRSMESLAAHGCRAVSLTVTAANESALRLYRNMGFIEHRAFSAYVWEPK
ncbi:MAG TPA: GNAT family N-acetyltransferase [Bryobacteraceae bacterium]|nr:GNAT family N-acetyltransferase [Bryobacteraceae bacterium]